MYRRNKIIHVYLYSVWFLFLKLFDLRNNLFKYILVINTLNGVKQQIIWPYMYMLSAIVKGYYYTLRLIQDTYMFTVH